ncbi:DUF5055 domain-containing protein [Methanobrevibacter sp.]|uniref:DUF5055 domain-containing protein n=1 Tax=Methanobrevibacter sp. TaxID=66852 RepID=UPI00388D68EC
MSKIKLQHKDKEYILEFSRNTAKAIEERGFNLELVGIAPNKMIPLLIQGAFMKNHPTLKQTKVEEIFLAQKGRAGLINALAELYAETVNSLLGNEDEDDEKNATWEMI